MKSNRNDPCPCGSAKSFQALLPPIGLLLMAANAMTTGVNELQRHFQCRNTGSIPVRDATSPKEA